MKGVVFTELMTLIETTWDADTLDAVIDASGVPDDAAYTAVGTYPAQEMCSLVRALSMHTHVPGNDLMRAFGGHLFKAFLRQHPHFFDVADPLDFLASIDSVIHVEVHKLDPNAELPTFDVIDHAPDRLVLLYRSPRAMGPVADGLIRATLAHWGRQGTITITSLTPDGTEARFEIELQA